ncbi:MAG: hypothetical protein II245_07215 [Bacteroidaceae bacterium]|nr:hypothetical protein [Bacteroidaceae bacterium]MBR0543992.1 hypothetical protein [Bacteroidaceae bacterium]
MALQNKALPPTWFLLGNQRNASEYDDQLRHGTRARGMGRKAERKS